MLRIFNTMTKKKENFKPIKGKKIKIFVCGQTVYDDAHLGHAKTYVNFDVIVRYLRHVGYDVNYVQNITDIDDKIINRAREKLMPPLELAKHYTKRFFEDMEKLKIKKTVNSFPKSTDYIPEIINQIKTLIKKGYAYTIDGDVFFDVSKFKDYTKLSRMKLEDLKMHRIEPDERKKNPYDFSLWKKSKEGEISWDSPWGRGRPGWHIEDTAITVANFGPQYDIHGGASELIFPHHTNEIAQAEAATGKRPFVRYWMHSGVLNIRGEKMSKSLKNFVTVRETLQKYSPEAIRMWIASTHYRKPMNYKEEDLELAEKKVRKIRETLDQIEETMKKASAGKSNFAKKVDNLYKNFRDAMDDDFNTPLALSHFLATILLVNKNLAKGKLSKSDLKKAKERIVEMGSILQIIPPKIEMKIPKAAEILIEERERMRKVKNFEKADEIRRRLKDEFGIILEDTKTGVKWKKI